MRLFVCVEPGLFFACFRCAVGVAAAVLLLLLAL